MLIHAQKKAHKAIFSDLWKQYNTGHDVSHHKLSWGINSGTTIVNQNPHGNQRIGITHIQERRNSNVHHQQEKSWLGLRYEKYVILVNSEPTATTENCDHSTKTLRSQVNPKRKMCCSTKTTQGHSQGCPATPSQNSDEQCCYSHPTVLIVHHQIFTCFILWKTSCKYAITWMTR